MSACISYIGVGSNLDGPEQHTRQAISQLGEIKKCELLQVSSLYRSKPMGPQDQPDYINAVVSIRTSLEPLALLDALQRIEAEHGRVRKGLRWGPRTLDLDVLIYDEKIINMPRLKVPHPGLHERSFVLYPLYEINPDLTIPIHGSLSDLLIGCSQDGLEKVLT